MKIIISILGLCCLILSGCMPPRYTYVFTPPTATVENDHYVAKVTPVVVADTAKYFSLEIENKTEKNLEVDWNKTLYIDNGQTNGGFMYHGIVYADRNNPRMPDAVFPKSKFIKTISPNNLVSYSPPNQYSSGGWLQGDLHPGESGIYLTTRIDGKEFSEKLIINISATEIKPTAQSHSSSEQ